MTTISRWRGIGSLTLQQKTLGLFLLFLIVGLMISSRSLSYYWFYDDLHLIRVYSPDELHKAFTGAWDVDGIETAGYRPLTTLFNHIRAVAFGENTMAQRIFMILLFALCLTIFSRIAIRLGMTYSSVVFAGVLAICSRYNWFNLTWIADGIHPFIGIMLGLAILILFSYLDKPSPWKIVACVGFATMAIFSREDSVAIFPLIPGFALYKIFHSLGWDQVRVSDLLSCVRQMDGKTRRQIRAIVLTTIILTILGILAFLLRFIFIPASISITLLGWFTLFKFVLFPMGLPSPLWGDVWLHDV